MFTYYFPLKYKWKMQQSIDESCNPGNKQQCKVREKSVSVKKLIQARLPFKRIDSASSPRDLKVEILKNCATDEIRKRKLCLISDEDDKSNILNNLNEEDSDSKVKKRKDDGEVEHNINDIIFLGDSSEQEEDCPLCPYNSKQTVDNNIRPKLQLKSSFNEKMRRKSKEIAIISPKTDLQQQKKTKFDEDGINIRQEIKIGEISQGVAKKGQIFNDVIDVDDEDDEQFCSSLVTYSKQIESVRELDVEDKAEDNGKLSRTTCHKEEEFDDNSTVMTNIALIHATDRTGEIKKKSVISKQRKLLAQRRKAREEKERKLQEQRKQKQLLKQNKELLKKLEREKCGNLQKKIREEKERKRLAELEARNAERRKRIEIKEEEWRKKEDERKRKEQEKEEMEFKKKKASEAFTKFFVPKSQPPNLKQLSRATDCTDNLIEQTLAFQPFQLKGDMKLAPIHRRNFTLEARIHLDNILCNKIVFTDTDNGMDSKSSLYLAQLKEGKFLPVKWRRTFENSNKDDVIVVDELDRIGQAILEETTCNKREAIKAKFYKFHDNRRPPYYGTWRKKSTVVTSRRPFLKDTKYFDYDIDSNDEWEEEEPGESLNGSEEDKDSQDDDYEVDNEWFVPHGHLSEEELQNRDDILESDEANNGRETQKVKLLLLQQEFTQEMKKKTEKIKPRLIGCIWVDENGNQPENCTKILWDNLQVRAMLCSEPLIIEKSGFHCHPLNMANDIAEKMNEKLKPITLTNELVKKLASLMHGNKHSRNFLINEFIAYIEKTEDAIKRGDVRGPLKSVVRDKINEIAQWKVIDRVHGTPVEVSLNVACDGGMENHKKKKEKRRKELCWVVDDHILNEMGLENLDLRNTWSYTLTPRINKLEKVVPAVRITMETKSECKKQCSVGNETWKIKKSIARGTSFKKHEYAGSSTPISCDGETVMKQVATKTKLISEFLNKSLASQDSN